jgi:hypothetical protein
MRYNNIMGRYEKVYMPSFVRTNKQKVDGFEYVKTIDAGSSVAHILKGKDGYMMCLSYDEDVSVEVNFKEPAGFYSNNIQHLDDKAKYFNEIYYKETCSSYWGERRKWPRMVVPPKIDASKVWKVRMTGHYLINTKNGAEVHLGDNRSNIMTQTGLTAHLIYCMLRDGVEANNWCYKGTRVDNVSWDEYIRQKIETRAEKESKITFRKDGKVIRFVNLRETSKQLDISHETLRKALITREQKVNGYSISYF